MFWTQNGDGVAEAAFASFDVAELAYATGAWAAVRTATGRWIVEVEFEGNEAGEVLFVYAPDDRFRERVFTIVAGHSGVVLHRTIERRTFELVTGECDDGVCLANVYAALAAIRPPT